MASCTDAAASRAEAVCADARPHVGLVASYRDTAASRAALSTSDDAATTMMMTSAYAVSTSADAVSTKADAVTKCTAAVTSWLQVDCVMPYVNLESSSAHALTMSLLAGYLLEPEDSWLENVLRDMASANPEVDVDEAPSSTDAGPTCRQVSMKRLPYLMPTFRWQAPATTPVSPTIFWLNKC